MSWEEHNLMDCSKDFLSASAENHGCKPMDKCVYFLLFADFALPKKGRIPWTYAHGALF